MVAIVKFEIKRRFFLSGALAILTTLVSVPYSYIMDKKDKKKRFSHLSRLMINGSKILAIAATFHASFLLLSDIYSYSAVSSQTTHFGTCDRQCLYKYLGKLKFCLDEVNVYFPFLLGVAYDKPAYIHVFGSLMEH